jgi:hypothetical protein
MYSEHQWAIAENVDQVMPIAQIIQQYTLNFLVIKNTFWGIWV